MRTRLSVLLALLSTTLILNAEPRFSRHYSDNMVLQREKPVLIRGLAEKGESVTVSFAGQTKKTKADDDGEWAIKLDPMPANAKGQELKVSGKVSVSLKNVVVGDVFLFARQTSIDVSLGKDEAGKKAADDIPAVRVLMITTTPELGPLQDLTRESTSGWAILNKDAALKMSAAAFYTAKNLAKEAGVPVGIIDLNMGYHFPVAWLSKPALLETKEIFDGAGQVETMIGMMEKKQAAYAAEQADPANANRTRGGIPMSPAVEDARFPAAGYNAVLHPMRGHALKAILLQVGNDYPYYLYAQLKREGKDTSRPHLGLAYEDTYDIRKWCGYLTPLTVPRLPREWRKTFGDEALPVGLITPPGSDLYTMGKHHYEMREVQRQVTEKEKGVDLILPGIRHVPFSAQPADEALLGQRCVAWLDGAVYKKNGAAGTGPVFDRAVLNGSEAQIFFKPGTDLGLKAAPGALDYFEVSGLAYEYVPAKAELDGKTVRLSSDSLDRIVFIRYNWTGKPDQGLTNESGLPAVPFKTDDLPFEQRIFHPDDPPFEEFSTPVSQWKTDGPVIYNGKMNSTTEGGKFLGPTGLRVSEFGPNLLVNNAYVGSPADGKIFHGDFIYAVNGELFGQDMFAQIAEAITKAETEEGKGLISFDLMRKGEKMTVELQLEVLGSYSITSPYNCPKTDRIVANAEKYLADRGGSVLTVDGKGKTKGTHSLLRAADAMFLLGAGSPECQGLVRRQVYQRLEEGGGPWDLGADMLLLAEYYLATGDKNVLPHLARKCDQMTSRQVRPPEPGDEFPMPAPGASGGWRHNHPGGYYYGTMPAIGVPAALGYHLAKESGVQYDFSGYSRAVQWFLHNGAKVGSIGYGFSATERTTGNYIDPERLVAGKLGPGNGGVGGAALLFDLIGNGPVARTCSFVATHCYNNTAYAHGGHFWLNLYTPLGAKVHGKKSFQFYMKGNRNYQELHRMFDHSREQNLGLGVGQYLAYVVPRERLRILGAHESVFAPNPPEVLKPALADYFKRDYANAEKKVIAILDKGDLNGLDLKQAEQLRDAAALVQKSIALDVAKVKKLIAEKKPYEAGLDIAQLEGVVPEGDADLAAIKTQLNDPVMKGTVKDDKKRYDEYVESLALRMPADKDEAEADDSGWQALITVDDGKSRKEGETTPEWSKWRMKIIESYDLAPKGWAEPDFDDSAWTETTLPISWRDNHTSLLRTKFEIKDPKSVKALRLDQYAFQQRSIQVFLNGKVVAKISDSGGGSRITVPLNDHAVKLLKKGENTLAVTYKHNWRWGRYFKGTGSCYGHGVNLALQVKDK